MRFRLVCLISLVVRYCRNPSCCLSADNLLHSHARWMLISPLRKASKSSDCAVVSSCLTLLTFPTDTPALAAISVRTSTLSLLSILTNLCFVQLLADWSAPSP